MRKDTEPRGPYRAQAPSPEISRGAGMNPAPNRSWVSEAAVSWSKQAEAGDRREGKHGHHQQAEVPGGEPAHKMLKLWAEENYNVGKNQSAVINILFPTKKSSKV